MCLAGTLAPALARRRVSNTAPRGTQTLTRCRRGLLQNRPADGEVRRVGRAGRAGSSEADVERLQQPLQLCVSDAAWSRPSARVVRLAFNVMSDSRPLQLGVSGAAWSRPSARFVRLAFKVMSDNRPLQLCVSDAAWSRPSARVVRLAFKVMSDNRPLSSV